VCVPHRTICIRGRGASTRARRPPHLRKAATLLGKESVDLPSPPHYLSPRTSKRADIHTCCTVRRRRIRGRRTCTPPALPESKTKLRGTHVRARHKCWHVALHNCPLHLLGSLRIPLSENDVTAKQSCTVHVEHSQAIRFCFLWEKNVLGRFRTH
jgi:hypothetical protein